jgi:hypothetical protein
MANFFAVVLSSMPHFAHGNLSPFKLMFEQIVDREMNAWNDIDATTLWASLLRKP